MKEQTLHLCEWIDLGALCYATVRACTLETFLNSLPSNFENEIVALTKKKLEPLAASDGIGGT